MGDVQESKQKKKFVELYGKYKLSPMEELIFKPLGRNGLSKLTEEEFETYLNLDIESLRKAEIEEGERKKTTINMKTLVIAEETKKFLIEHKEEILKKIKLNDLARPQRSPNVQTQRSEKEEDEYAR